MRNVLTLAALILASSTVAAGEREAFVRGDETSLLAGPGSGMPETARLRRGTRLRIHHEEGDYYAVQPPAGSISWVRAGYVQFVPERPGGPTVFPVAAVVDANNNFRGTVPTTSGTNTFTVVAKDASGNTTTKQYEIGVTGSTKTFTYDANGNLTSDGIRTFEWDALNQLAAVDVGTHRSEFTYDGDRRRVRVVERARREGVPRGDRVSGEVVVLQGAHRADVGLRVGRENLADPAHAPRRRPEPRVLRLGSRGAPIVVRRGDESLRGIRHARERGGREEPLPPPGRIPPGLREASVAGPPWNRTPPTPPRTTNSVPLAIAGGAVLPSPLAATTTSPATLPATSTRAPTPTGTP